MIGRLNGNSLMARVLRSSGLTVISFASSQFLRLLSNLILTRLLFPEAFGMMALATVIIQGLLMVSDAGISPAIVQSKRGDDPAFLNTAWTMHVGRGIILYFALLILSGPLATFYGQPLLGQILPYYGVTLLLTGLHPTRIETANRHLLIGRLTLLEFLGQFSGIILAVAFAWYFQTVWALVASGIVGAVIQLCLYHFFLPGLRNNLSWDKTAAKELFTFGKWIFPSTICGFLYMQSDKVLLGKYLSLDEFGIYNIAFFLASPPLMLGALATRKVLVPVYRERPPAENPANFRALQRLRFITTIGLLLLLTLFALVADWLVSILYDPRYELAGAIAITVAISQVPQIIALTYDHAALAAGDSRRFFVLTLAKSIAMIAALFYGVISYGLLGAIVGQAVAMIAAYPVVVWLARRMGVWDPLHDVIMTLFSIILIGIIATIHHEKLVVLLQLG